jgi:flagellin
MGLFVNTNLASISAQHNLLGSQNSINKAFQRLSSGLRINSAGDDAAGLAISERFTSQIRGLGQALRNANDATSLAQVAEGALAESVNILQRMRELAVQAANDVNTSDDRNALQQEVNQLIDELTRIGDTTRFNGQKLLDGSFTDSFFQVGAFARETIRVRIRDARSQTVGRQATQTGTAVTVNPLAANDLFINGITIRATQAADDTVSTSFATGSAIAKAAAINASTQFTGVTAKVLPTDLTGAGRIAGGTLDNVNNIVINGQVIAGITVSPDDAGNTLVHAINEVSEKTGVIAALDANSHLVLHAEDGRNIEVVAHGAGAAMTGVATQVKTASINLYSENQYTVSGNNEAFIGFANNALVGVTANEAVTTVDVTTRFGANESILKLDRAIQQINSDRAELGAVENRVQSILSNLNNIVENSTAARSRIQDADFAQETANLTRAQILQQAGISVLSQANQQPQTVLGLLQR